MTQAPGSWTKGGVVGVVAALLVGACATSKTPAPVEDRVAARAAAVAAAASAAAAAAAPPAVASAPVEVKPIVVAPPADAPKPLPGSENAGKPGYYSVKPGDTIIRIGLETGQNWKDLVKWNNLDNPNIVEVGQVLRVVPPGTDPSAATRPVTAARVETRPLDAKPPAGPASTAPATAAAPGPGVVAPATGAAVAAVVAAPATAPAAPAAREADDDVNWLWPAAGSVVAPFEEGKTKGLMFAGKAGDPVLAAAEGKVVYAGSGLRGYGNLVILKHNNTYLTAYAHNQALLVKEDQAVRRGQKIAEMGSTDASRVQLHFEIRRQGKPIDPAKLLPPR
ncbi:MAG: peptidase [Methylibium sp. NZG]|nr:MAG: peptidase [Methylibium sp. NZG]